MFRYILILFFFVSIIINAQVRVGETYPYVKNGILDKTGVVISYPNATFIKVHFSEMSLQQNFSISFSSKDGTYSSILNKDRIGNLMNSVLEKGFWSPAIPSDTMVIKPLEGTISYSIDAIAVGNVSLMEVERSICNLDNRKGIECYNPSSIYDKSRAVGRMLFSIGGTWYVCTGSLVSCENHFFTANHCISDQTSADTLDVWWEYQYSACNSGTASHSFQSLGSTLIAANSILDYSLLLVTDQDPVASLGFMAFSSNMPSISEGIYIPQHGAGNPKTVSYESDMDTGGYASVQNAMLDGDYKNTDFGYFADTEGGSSGSPVLDFISNEVIGLHHWGTGGGACSNSLMNQGVIGAGILSELEPVLPSCSYNMNCGNSSEFSPNFPCDGSSISLSSNIPAFTWYKGNWTKFRVEVSDSNTFNNKITSKTPAKKWLKTDSWQPTQKKWDKIKELPGDIIYWRVKAKTPSGTIVNSAVFSATFY